jgi:hypothetical protein
LLANAGELLLKMLSQCHPIIDMFSFSFFAFVPSWRRSAMLCRLVWFTELPLDAAWTTFHVSLEFSLVVVPILSAKCRMYIPLASLMAMFQRLVANLILATIKEFLGSGLLSCKKRWQSFSIFGWREFLLNSYQSTVGLGRVVTVDCAASFTVEKKVV